MICYYTVYKFCKEDLSLIENYEEAIKSDETYDCHHRKETDEGYTMQELIDLGLYYDRPASELIFLTKSDHRSLHFKGKERPSLKGKTSWMKGKHHTEEAKRKLSESHKGKKCHCTPHSEETKEKIRVVFKGKHWYKDEASGKRIWT